MRDTPDVRPVLCVMNMQEAIAHPGGATLPHLETTTARIKDFIGEARQRGVAVAWIFHTEGKKAIAPFVTDDFARAREELVARGATPLDDLPVAAGDRIWVRPQLLPVEEKLFTEQLAALGIGAHTPVAGCGFYLDEPAKDGTYVWAQELESRMRPTILHDLTDNPEPFAHDRAAQDNVAFLKRMHHGIMWMPGRDWLDVVKETTQPPTAGTPHHASVFDMTAWLDALTKDCPVRRGVAKMAGKIAELAS